MTATFTVQHSPLFGRSWNYSDSE